MTSPAYKTTLTPLYGILITEQSYLFAIRREATRKYAISLAHRILFPRLPIELVEQVADELAAALGDTDARRVWRSKRYDRESRYEGFKAASESNGRLRSSGVRATSVKVNPPGFDSSPYRYVHLSMGVEQPGVEMLVPGTTMVGSGGPAASYAKGMVQVSCRPYSGEEASRVVAEYRGGSEESVKGRVDTLLLLDGVEEAIRSWDEEFVGKLVKEWRLNVIALKEEGGLELKPRLRMMQVVSWE